MCGPTEAGNTNHIIASHTPSRIWACGLGSECPGLEACGRAESKGRCPTAAGSTRDTASYLSLVGSARSGFADVARLQRRRRRGSGYDFKLDGSHDDDRTVDHGNDRARWLG